MVTTIKSGFIEKYFGEQIEYIKHDGPNGSLEDDTVVTVAYKQQFGGKKERILLKDLIKRTLEKHLQKQ